MFVFSSDRTRVQLSLILTTLCTTFLCLVEMSEASPTGKPLGLGMPALSFTQLTIHRGEVKETERALKIPSEVKAPLLVIYLPAQLTAKEQAMALVKPIKRGLTSVQNLRFVTILDLSAATFGSRWIVRRMYRGDRQDDPQEQVEFWIDEEGKGKKAWGIPEDTVVFTLYHPDYPPLSGRGQASVSQLNEIMKRLGITEERAR